jgi:hypothetical protein
MTKREFKTWQAGKQLADLVIEQLEQGNRLPPDIVRKAYDVRSYAEQDDNAHKAREDAKTQRQAWFRAHDPLGVRKLRR